jgi:O-succinylbenzoic acid--CoA ligase
VPDLIAVRAATAAAFLAAWDEASGRGDAVLPLSPTAPEAEVERIVATLAPGTLVEPDPGGRLRGRRLAGGREVRPGTALVVPTSGSTGVPKGVVLSRSALTASTRASVARLGCRTGERWLLCLPLAHVAGLQVVLRSRQLGTEPVVHDGFDVAAIDAAVRSGSAQHVSLVPTQLHRLLEDGVDLAGVRTVLLGGARAPDELLARAREAGVRVVVSYGMTETCGGCVYDGVPLDGVEVDLVGDGRIRVAGPVLMDGYRDRPDLTAPVLDDGWFATSDLGRTDDQGRLEVLGRADDVIITGGENVGGAAVADAVRTHPAIADAAAVGRDDPEWGQRVVAVCELAVDAVAPTLAELRAHLRERLPGYALPRELVIVAALPRTGLGKPDGEAIRALL